MSEALLVIDVQQGLCEGPGAAHETDALIDRINGLTARARAAGVPVIFVQHESAAAPLVHGSEGWQLARGLHREESDLLLRKTAADAFHRTALAPVLESQGVDALVICGMHSEFCIDTTTRRALALGLPVTLVEDGHTSAGNPHLSAPQVIAHHNHTLSQLMSFGPRVRLVAARSVAFQPAGATEAG